MCIYFIFQNDNPKRGEENGKINETMANMKNMPP